MNRYVFATRNVFDKLRKMARNPGAIKFYWQTYVLSRFDAVEPDVYIVSYPKCGRTWLRVMLQRYLELEGFSLREHSNKFVLDIVGQQKIKFEHGQGNWVPAPPSIEKLAFKTDKYRDQRVIFLVRDPRDVLVSSWYHLQYRERIYRQGLSAFIRDDLVGIRKVVAFMNMWIENSHVPQDFMLLTYEELHKEPLSSFKAVLEFVGLDVEPATLQEAVAESSFKRMKRMESAGSLREPWMKPGAKGLEKSMKVRKGEVGGFRQELSGEEIEFLDSVIQSTLSPQLPYQNA